MEHLNYIINETHETLELHYKWNSWNTWIILLMKLMKHLNYIINETHETLELYY